jgi:hypothetical protein
VAFDGYLFKRYRYKGGDGWREAPLLIGRGLVARKSDAPAPDDAGSYTDWLLPGFFGVVGVTLVLALTLGWWFRQGDRRVRRSLGSVQMSEFIEPGNAENPSRGA